MARKPPTVHGMALIDKPAGMTSHDVVAKLRKRFNERRIGHAGTLDPEATGLLVVGIGNATRLLRFASASYKTYEVEIVLGSETNTLDASGEVVAEHQMSVEADQVRAAARTLTGQIEQVPPMVSARRVGGRRLHEIAREGLEVDREPRPVTVASFEIQSTADPLVWRAVVVAPQVPISGAWAPTSEWLLAAVPIYVTCAELEAAATELETAAQSTSRRSCRLSN